MRVLRQPGAHRPDPRALRLGRVARPRPDLRLPAHLRRQGALLGDAHLPPRPGDVRGLVRRPRGALADATAPGARDVLCERRAHSARRMAPGRARLCPGGARRGHPGLPGPSARRLASWTKTEPAQAPDHADQLRLLVVLQHRGLEPALGHPPVRALPRRAVPEHRLGFQPESRRKGRPERPQPLPLPPARRADLWLRRPRVRLRHAQLRRERPSERAAEEGAAGRARGLGSVALLLRWLHLEGARQAPRANRWGSREGRRPRRRCGSRAGSRMHSSGSSS